MTAIDGPAPFSVPPRRFPLLPTDAGQLERRLVAAGLCWLLLASLLGLALLAPLALGRGLAFAPLGPGRLAVALRLLGFWGLSLPLAGGLLRVAGLAAAPPTAARWVGLGFWAWQLALAGGLLAVLAGGAGPDAWAAAPGLAQLALLLASACWAFGLWLAVLAAGPRLTVAQVAALVAAVALVSLQAVRAMGLGIGGVGQAVTLGVASRGLLDVWLVMAGVAVAAEALPRGLGRPLFGRRAALLGLALWLPMAVMAAGRDLAPDLLPALVSRLGLAASALLLAPATLLAVALLGTWVGGERRAPGSAALFASLGLLALLAAALVAATGALAAAGPFAFTAWSPLHGLPPPLVAGWLFATAAAYLVWGNVDGPWPRRHAWLAAAAALLSVMALWPLAVAEAASGPSLALAQAGARLGLAGAVAWLLTAVVWAGLAWRARGDGGAAPPARAGDLALRPGTVVGATVLGLVGTLFLTLFAPLADPAAVTRTARTETREQLTAPSWVAGRDRYLAEGCVACHTQRVRALPEDVAAGPPTLRGDYGGGPAPVGFRRLGPDLMWVGDRYGTREALAAAMAAHAAGGALAMPWLLAAEGPTAEGGALLDYLVGLRSAPAAAP